MKDRRRIKPEYIVFAFLIIIIIMMRVLFYISQDHFTGLFIFICAIFFILIGAGKFQEMKITATAGPASLSIETDKNKDKEKEEEIKQ